ncbi:uncharacterized protein C8A04DRAFT_11106 [Dichotomopilus funicola]|uniref:Zn(2)-C6 fungal-type domain-containing protein n=1 Tax=Dichotomopilus funicola TaxID=1934379 RepID=A0AAN6ZND7_9PEZI|nr:hypothetical protein C8A04DRAFT_11106 [Dichotomopilus funicola]
MLRRSHKKSRAGCLECKRRHVKCDEQRPRCIICTLSERECSYPQQSASSPLSPAGSTPSTPGPVTAQEATADPPSSFIAAIATSNETSASPVAGVPLPDISGREPTLTPNTNRNNPEVNMAHMELLVRFEFEEHAPELNVELRDFASELLFKCSLEAPYLMHQILAVSARRQAALQSERTGYFLETAIHLQTKAVSIYNETAAKAQIDQTNCSALLLFCSLLGRHLLADLLARRDANFGEFLPRFLELLSISRGLMAMSVSAWDLLLQSDIKHLVLWALEISQSTPRGHHCDELQRLVAESTNLDAPSKEACVAAIASLQVGFDSILGGDARNQRYLMVFMWAPVVPQKFTDLLSQQRPEAIAIMGHWALLLHYTRSLWHVADSGSYLLKRISEYLGPSWAPWLSWPLSVLAADTPN